MIIIAETSEELNKLKKRLRTITYHCGPLASIKLMDDQGSLAAESLGGSSLPVRCANLNERIETMLQSLGN